jgi:hypothetical protein
MAYRNLGYRRFNRKSGTRSVIQKRRRYKSVAGKKLATTVRKLVQRNISKNIENKSIITYSKLIGIPGPIVGETVVGSGLNTDTFPILPVLNPGNKSHQRVGQKIRPMSLWCSGYVWLDPSLDTQGQGGVNNSGVNVRLYMLSSKAFKTYNALEASQSGSINGYGLIANNLVMANGTEGNFDGSLERSMAFKTNTKRVTVHGIRNLHMRRDFAPSVSVPTSGGNLQPVKRTFAFKIAIPKQLTYSSDTAVLPSNFAPFLMAGYTYDNGVVPSASPTAAGPKITFTTKLVYEDA